MVYGVVILAHAFNNNEKPLAVGGSLDVPCTMAPGLTFSRKARIGEWAICAHLRDFWCVKVLFDVTYRVYTASLEKK